MQINKDSSDLTAREIFTIMLEYFQGTYPKRNIRMDGSIVEINGEQKFNIEGYNLLYNLTRLCKELKSELE